MATPEQRLNQWIQNALPKTWHRTRIETTTGRGVPDLHVASPWGSFWIESKAEHKVPWLRPEQYAWAAGHNRAGGVSLVVHKVGSGAWFIYRPNISILWSPNKSGFMIPDSGLIVSTGIIHENLVESLTQILKSHARRSADNHS